MCVDRIPGWVKEREVEDSFGWEEDAKCSGAGMKSRGFESFL